jgi:hypothetical protein
VFAGSYAIYSRPSLFNLEEGKNSLNIPLEPITESLLNEITPSTFKEVMSNKKNKFIFFSNADLTDNTKEYIELVVSSMQEMFPIDAYYLNLRSLNEQLKQYLKDNNIQINIEDNYNFILTNQFSDHWFWSFDLLDAFMAREIITDLVRYFQGVKTADAMV